MNKEDDYLRQLINEECQDELEENLPDEDIQGENDR